MTTMTIYRNYGVQAAEKRNVYTFGEPHPQAVCSDRLVAEIPQGWELYENQAGEGMVQAPWGWCYEVGQVLQGNKTPCFFALDREGNRHRAYLDVIPTGNKEEKS